MQEEERQQRLEVSALRLATKNVEDESLDVVKALLPAGEGVAPA